MIIFPALFGLAICLLNAAGAKLFCLTTGCALYAGYTFLGLSFYVYGAIAFALISLLALRAGKIPGRATPLGWVILAFLALDLLFFAWQLLYWPCSSCLVVALSLGLTAVGFWRNYPRWHRRLFTGVLLVWLALLIPVAIAAGKEILLPPWALFGPPAAPIRVFFSPTCPACAIEITKLLQSPDVGRMAFYPIAKNDQDLRLLAALLDEGISAPADLGRLFGAGLKETLPPSLHLRWRLARNKMTLAKMGVQTIPAILTPATIAAPGQPWDNLFSPAGQPAETGGCGAFGQPDLPCK